jgi:hypothetical protein
VSMEAFKSPKRKFRTILLVLQPCLPTDVS